MQMAVRVEKPDVFQQGMVEPCWSGSSSGRWLARAVAVVLALEGLQTVPLSEVFDSVAALAGQICFRNA